MFVVCCVPMVLVVGVLVVRAVHCYLFFFLMVCSRLCYGCCASLIVVGCCVVWFASSLLFVVLSVVFV